jgi:thiol:disulfide interchange protein
LKNRRLRLEFRSHPSWNARRQQALPGMDAVMAFFSGTGGLIAGACVAAFLAGWFLLRRNARKLKETS